MGQYYKPLSLEKKQYVYSHDITYTFKRDDGKTFKMGHGLKLMEHSWVQNDFVNAVASLIAVGGAWHGDRLVWAGDYADNERSEKTGRFLTRNLYSIVGENKIIPAIPKKIYRYFLNLDTKEFVDVTKCPEEDLNDPGWQIHPLPLLTCEGNNRGGGDFRKEHPMIGAWARNHIEASYTKPKGTEIFPNFTERDVVYFPPKKTKKVKATKLKPDLVAKV
jgi:hypothetical protein